MLSPVRKLTCRKLWNLDGSVLLGGEIWLYLSYKSAQSVWLFALSFQHRPKTNWKLYIRKQKYFSCFDQLHLTHVSGQDLVSKEWKLFQHPHWTLALDALYSQLDNGLGWGDHGVQRIRCFDPIVLLNNSAIKRMHGTSGCNQPILGEKSFVEQFNCQWLYYFPALKKKISDGKCMLLGHWLEFFWNSQKLNKRSRIFCGFFSEVNQTIMVIVAFGI